MEPEPTSSDASERPAAVPRAAPLDWARASGATEPVTRAVEAYVRRRRRLSAAGAALVVLLAGAGVLWQSRREFPANGSPAAHIVISAPERQALSDGSVVELKAGAEIAVDFTPVSRRVTLRRGTAMFLVAKNRARPFVVSAGMLEVRAVGTAFSVDCRPATVEVLVTEGRVAVENRSADADRDGGERKPLAFIDAGKGVLVDLTPGSAAAPQVQAVPAVEITDGLAWRAPQLEFSATPLSEVIATVNQYSRVKLALADPATGQLELSGVLRANNVGVLVRILETSYGVTGEARGDEIVLRKSR